tara:strand:- start:1314 stop:1634 length:321 start_codon:yes stop_codon:yes gene_type:complete
MPEDISEFTNAEETTYTFYDKDGSIITENVELSCAYIAKLKGAETHYIKTLRGMLFDPQGMDGGKLNSLASKFSKVKKETFDFYVDYLKTKEKNYYSWAERNNIDV